MFIGDPVKLCNSSIGEVFLLGFMLKVKIFTDSAFVSEKLESISVVAESL